MTRLAKRRIARAKGRAEEKRDAAARAKAWDSVNEQINAVLRDIAIAKRVTQEICTLNLMSKGEYSL